MLRLVASAAPLAPIQVTHVPAYAGPEERVDLVFA
jgi:hypothetical protein